MVMYTFLKRDQQNFLAKEPEKTFCSPSKKTDEKEKENKKKKTILQNV